MYKILNIGGKDYKLEYAVEASLYADCTTKLVEFLGTAYGSAEVAKNIGKAKTDSQIDAAKTAIHESLQNIANIPDVALTLFYAGLMEHHGYDGEGNVTSMREAKNLVKQYFKEHEDDDQGDFFSLLQICIEQMGEDGFFKRIGLEKMFGQSNPDQKPVPISRSRKSKP